MRGGVRTPAGSPCLHIHQIKGVVLSIPRVVSPHVRDTSSSSSGLVSSLVSRKVANERILAELDRLAALPTVAMDVIRIADDMDSTVGDLEEIISHDPVITARLFKLANSTFYSRSGTVSTIGDAVKRLGFKTIKNLVMAACAGKVLTKPMKHYTYSEFGLWQHSLGLALISRSVARNLQLPSYLQDELFLAGLMHDIGKLLLDSILDDTTIEASRLTPDMEVAAVGLDHTEVGCRMAKKWKLPDFAVAAIEHHHNLGSPPEFAQHSAAIHVADGLINHAKVGLAVEGEVEANIDSSALDLLNIDFQMMGDLEEAITDELPHVMGICDELTRC